MTEGVAKSIWGYAFFLFMLECEVVRSSFTVKQGFIAVEFNYDHETKKWFDIDLQRGPPTPAVTSVRR